MVWSFDFDLHMAQIYTGLLTQPAEVSEVEM
jgi:hypothetical protein